MVRRPGLACSQCLFTEYERNTVLLPDSSVAGDAILIQNGPDIPAELHSILGSPTEEKTRSWPSQYCGYRNNKNYSRFRFENARFSRFGHGGRDKYRGKVDV